ncbi:MAG: anthrax toxin-like adenylyl cyclase domain-containing protein [Terriglobia bacterium]
MALIQGPEAYEKSGMPPEHGKCFQEIAAKTNCVISSRSVGKYATQLLREGYATKGFHNKAKSCNWGPMAGFVLSDPRFTKRGGARDDRETQRTDLFKAFKHGAGEMQVFISEMRRHELMKLKGASGGPCIVPASSTLPSDDNNKYYFGPSPSGEQMLFLLRRTSDAPGAFGKPLWGVFYALVERKLPSALRAPKIAKGMDYLPVAAMVDPFCSSAALGTYRSATTGDYDLFAVFPKMSQFRPHGQDKRPVPQSDRFKVPIREYIKHENPDMGNITLRVRSIMAMLNNRISQEGYRGGNVVHHSDEAGRPGVDEIDAFIAFVPEQPGPYFVEEKDVEGFKEFIAVCTKRGFQVTFNPGWLKKLSAGFGTGIMRTPKGASEV